MVFFNDVKDGKADITKILGDGLNFVLDIGAEMLRCNTIEKHAPPDQCEIITESTSLLLNKTLTDM